MTNEPYSYLGTPSVVPVELAPDVEGPRDRILELPEDQEKRAMCLHHEAIVFDLHNHVHRLARNMERDFELYARSGRVAIGFGGIARSGLTACFNGYGGSAGRRSSPQAWQFDDVLWDIGTRQADIYHHPETATIGTCVADIHRAKKEGRCAIFVNIENAGIIGNELDRIDVLYGLGARCLGLSYNQRSTIADGTNERVDGGLSVFGEKVVERMNRLGILIDLAHSSDQTILDTLQVSSKPCCVSHALPQALSSHPKAKSDEMLKKIAQAGWVLGVQAVPNVTSDKPYQSIFDVADQIEHCVSVMGVDHVAVGTDAMFGDHRGLHRCISRMMAHPEKELVGEYIEYLENPGEMPNMARVLVSRGFSDEDIAKILGLNVVRLLEKTIG